MNTTAGGFLECTGAPGAPLSLLGVPFDGTCSYRPGARFGPAAVREASWSLETYSPDLGADLDGAAVADLGDLDLPPGDTGRVLAAAEAAAREIAGRGGRLVAIGGEHLVTLPLVRAAADRHPDLTLVQFDAHADLRDDYLGQLLSHATVIRRCEEVLGPGRIRQFGVRSGTREEFAWMRDHGSLAPATAEGVREALAGGTGPIYLSVDLDVFDPGFLPGTGTPEPGGMDWNGFSACLGAVLGNGRPVIGADVVELSPPWDPTGASAVLAAKVVREILVGLQTRG